MFLRGRCLNFSEQFVPILVLNADFSLLQWTSILDPSLYPLHSLIKFDHFDQNPICAVLYQQKAFQRLNCFSSQMVIIHPRLKNKTAFHFPMKKFINGTTKLPLPGLPNPTYSASMSLFDYLQFLLFIYYFHIVPYLRYAFNYFV